MTPPTGQSRRHRTDLNLAQNLADLVSVARGDLPDPRRAHPQRLPDPPVRQPAQPGGDDRIPPIKGQTLPFQVVRHDGGMGIDDGR